MLRQRSAARDLILRDTLAIVMAGGEGNRLGELTRSEAKPALPIAGHYRNIDFSLSNCVNSGIRHIGLLTQYKAHSLIQHIQRSWNLLHPELGEYLELWPAQQRAGKSWYLGTADAVGQNIDIIDEHNPKYVLVLAGDHVYKMDYLPMLETHLRSGADVTVGCIKVPLGEAHAYGILNADRTGRITRFFEKPANPAVFASGHDYALASMGIYIFDYPTLREALRIDAPDPDSAHDFARNIIPGLLERAHVQAFEFLDQHTGDAAYWRDVGTLDKYWQTNMELLAEPPPIDLCDNKWPILTTISQCAPARLHAASNVTASIVGAGCRVAGTVKHSVLSENVVIETGAIVEHSVLLPGAVVGRDCQIRNAVVDSKCRVPATTVVDRFAGARVADARPRRVISLVTAESLAIPESEAASESHVA